MQTLRADCSTAEPKNFAPPQTPFPGVQDLQNLISWRWSLPSPPSYSGNRPTNPQTNKHTNIQDQLQYTVPLSLAHSVTNIPTNKKNKNKQD